eukprot:CAMPEP_0198203316 /NCGR_PEP_ID=MMETSP1445-20131203/6580_1 /TAXON_ID=36898 /ORGANISM="Pyramimonas sp., Strain CCMP2087" /LENGTH=133 /DNA_ID=CAMNT_0043874649 /DNA_START=1061 /DNA_END=1462 /DNA_ORIENTATION=+
MQRNKIIGAAIDAIARMIRLPLPVPAIRAVFPKEAQMGLKLERYEPLPVLFIRGVGGGDVQVAEADRSAPLLLRAVAVHTVCRPYVLGSEPGLHVLELRPHYVNRCMAEHGGPPLIEDGAPLGDVLIHVVSKI